ncbi:SulP family sulfate permease [Marinoscillum furvescens DSM 4134]|uniref:SulP family sulfate permease n=2 Tax=Marinoscillum furvescens TaxID=1026 RepID=A0A3D9L387_MARFU|nr:SulP family sulfate permease [Marinoscillum furvescens DSM 4134]
MPHYQRKWLYGDLSAGLTVGVMLVPQGMAYAMIAGLPPVYGLYAALVPQLIYALMGTSRQLSVAPVAMDSLLVAAGVSVLATQGTAEYITFSLLLAFFVGFFQILLGSARLGFITNLLARPVISGFTSAAAFIIGINQLKYFLGVDLERSSQLVTVLWDAIKSLPEIHWLTFFIGLLAILIIKALKVVNGKIPGALVVVVVGIVAVYLSGWSDQGVRIVGEIPGGLPQFTLPNLDLSVFMSLAPLAGTIALVAFMEAYSVAKAIEARRRNYDVKPNQELLAIGSANLVGALFQSYPVTGGFSRSAVNDQAGAHTQLSSVISAMLVALVLLFLTPLFYYLPQAVLAAIIMVAVAKLVDVKYAINLFKTNRSEFVLLLITFLATLQFGMVEGIVSGVVLSILMMLYRIAYPHIAVLGRLQGYFEFRNIRRFSDLETWPELLLVRVDAPMIFVNVQYIRDFVLKELEKRPTVQTIILDANAISHVDATALEALMQLRNTLHERGIRLMYAELVGPVRDMLHKSGLIADIKEDVFLDMNEAVNYIVNKEPPQHGKEALQSN